MARDSRERRPGGAARGRRVEGWTEGWAVAQHPDPRVVSSEPSLRLREPGDGDDAGPHAAAIRQRRDRSTAGHDRVRRRHRSERRGRRAGGGPPAAAPRPGRVRGRGAGAGADHRGHGVGPAEPVRADERLGAARAAGPRRGHGRHAAAGRLVALRVGPPGPADVLRPRRLLPPGSRRERAAVRGGGRQLRGRRRRRGRHVRLDSGARPRHPAVPGPAAAGARDPEHVRSVEPDAPDPALRPLRARLHRDRARRAALAGAGRRGPRRVRRPVSRRVRPARRRPAAHRPRRALVGVPPLARGPGRGRRDPASPGGAGRCRPRSSWSSPGSRC